MEWLRQKFSTARGFVEPAADIMMRIARECN